MTNPDADRREALRTEVEGDFAAHLRAQTVETTPWDLADDELLVGLEQWGHALTERDPQLGIAALAAAKAACDPAHEWYAAVGQCLLAATEDKEAAHEVGRGLVMAALGMRRDGDTQTAIDQLVAGLR